MIETPAEILAHHASTEAANSFVAWRKAQRKPLTETAALRIAKSLAWIKFAGGDPSDALGMAEERGWQTIKSEWYFGALKDNARGKSTGPDATSNAINVAARADRTPRSDCF